MSGIKNYEKGETLATGFVKPKVTSLFFDKIWIPEEVLDSSFEFVAIPKNVLVLENENSKKSNYGSNRNIYKNYNYAVIENHPVHLDDIFAEDPKEFIKQQNEQKIFTPGELYLIKSHHNVGGPIEVDEFNRVKFMYSKNRNQAILLNAENFIRVHKLHISPIFHDLTEFEKESQNLEIEKLYGNKTLKYKLKRPNSFENKNVFAVCIQDFPSIKEDELSWEQVLYIRKDKKRREQLKRLTNWTNRNFANYTPEQIRETLESELEAYKDAIKEHGIKTAVGSFTTLVSGASSIASIISEPNTLLLPLLSITAVSINFTTNTYLSGLKNKKAPIAYLYDISNDEL